MHKPPLSHWLGQSVASTADALMVAVDWAMSQAHLDVAAQNPRVWMSYYWNTRELLQSVFRFHLSSELDALRAMNEAASKRISEGIALRDFQSEFMPQLEIFLAGMFDESKEDVRTFQLDPERLQTHLESVFAMLIITPCIARFDTFPSALFWEARRGDHTALLKLLVLDPLVVEDRRIRREIYRIRSSGNLSLQRRLANAINGKGFPFPKAKTMKARLTACTQTVLDGLDAAGAQFNKQHPNLAPILSHGLTVPDMIRAFDARARDVRGDTQDGDLPLDPAVFAKLVHRAKEKM